MVIGGDFNLLRCPSDKSNNIFSWPLANAFTDFISVNAIRELPRGGARYTWSNHQANPIRYVLDRVFICPRWDSMFPRAFLGAKCIVGSDHTPLILDDGSISLRPPATFQFDASWLSVDGFIEMVASKISLLLSSNSRSFGPLDDWHSCSYNLRKFLRGCLVTVQRRIVVPNHSLRIIFRLLIARSTLLGFLMMDGRFDITLRPP